MHDPARTKTPSFDQDPFQILACDGPQVFRPFLEAKGIGDSRVALIC
jgi:hypothetical protein